MGGWSSGGLTASNATIEVSLNLHIDSPSSGTIGQAVASWGFYIFCVGAACTVRVFLQMFFNSSIKLMSFTELLKSILKFSNKFLQYKPQNVPEQQVPLECTAGARV